jgi:hypothetical protein
MVIARMPQSKVGRPIRLYRSKSRISGRTVGGNTVAGYIKHQPRHSIFAKL